jgi:hypothetical protein
MKSEKCPSTRAQGPKEKREKYALVNRSGSFSGLTEMIFADFYYQ